MNTIAKLALTAATATTVSVVAFAYTGTDDLKNVQTIGADFQKEINRLVDDSNEMLKKFNGFKQNVESELAAKAREINTLNEEINNLTKQLETAEASGETSKKEVDRLTKELEKANKEIEKANDEAKKLNEEFMKMKKQVDEKLKEKKTADDMDTTLPTK